MFNTTGLYKTKNVFKKLFGHYYILLPLVAGLGIALSAVMFSHAMKQEDNQIQSAFNRASEDRISSLQRGLEESLQVLESISAFYAASESVTRKEFHEFVRPFIQHNPSIQGLVWAPRVPKARRDAFEREAGRDGLPGFQITEQNPHGGMVRSGKRKEYYPVYYYEPSLENISSLGFDLATEPTRQAALEQASDTGNMTATGRLTLAQEAGAQFGILVFQPIYQKGKMADTLAARRGNLAGFAVGVLRVDDMMEKSLSYLKHQDIEIHLFDDTAGPGNRFLYAYPRSLHVTSPHKVSEDKSSRQKGQYYSKTIDVAGRKWTFLCQPTAQYVSGRRTAQPWGILGTGLLVTFFLTGYIALMMRRTAQTQLLAERILNSEERFKELFENAPIGMIISDTDYRIHKANKAICGLLQYAEDDLIGRSIEDLTHFEDRKISLDLSRQIFHGERPRFQLEKRYIKKNGEPVWVHLTVAVIRNFDGKTSYGLGIMEDITERKKTENALRESEQRFRSLFENMLEGFAYCRMIYENDQPRDFVYLDVNGAFETLTGLKDVVGKKATEVLPGIREDHPELFETYGKVALGGAPEQFEIFSALFGGWLSVSAYSAGKGDFVAVFDNITERKHREREMEAIHFLSIALRSAENRADQFPIILDQLLTSLNLEGALLAMLDPSSGGSIVELARGGWKDLTGLRLPPGEGAIGHVISTGTGRSYLGEIAPGDPLLASPEMTEKLYSASCIPLIVEQQTIGALMVGWKTDVRDEDIKLLEAIGEIASISIHRLTLHKEALRQVQHLSALRDIDVAISSSLDMRVTLKVLLGHVTRELGADAAAVLLLNQNTQTLTYAAGHGFRTPGIEQTRIRLGEGCAGRAALERRIVSVPDSLTGHTMCPHVFMLKGENFISHHVAPLIIKGKVKGVLEILGRSPLHPGREWMEFFEALAGQAAIAIDNASLFQDLQHANDEIFLAYDATIEGWSRALDLRDKETEGHSLRVTDMTVTLARAMGLREDDLAQVRRGALLHDIGKMGVPDNILLKPGKLSDEEWVLMRKHPLFAYELLSPIKFLHAALDIPYYHHEKWDGTGYPMGLKGDQIPLAARIFSIVDVWDALGSDRPYRPAWPKEKMVRYIKDQTGKDFDPEVVDIFLKHVENF